MEISSKIVVPYKEWLRLKQCEEQLKKYQKADNSDEQKDAEKLEGHGECSEIGASLPKPLDVEQKTGPQFASKAIVIVKEPPIEGPSVDVPQENKFDPLTLPEAVVQPDPEPNFKKDKWFFLGYP
jgi:hypothetical protein